MRVETLRARVVGRSDQRLGRGEEGGFLGQNSLPGHAHTFPGAVILGELAPTQERPWREQSGQWAILSGQGLAEKKPAFFFFLLF